MNSISNVHKLIHLDLPATKVSAESSPMELIEWSFSRFDHTASVITTAFGMEGCALIDMFSRFSSELTIAYIDTGFFFPETSQIDRRNDQQIQPAEF